MKIILYKVIKRLKDVILSIVLVKKYKLELHNGLWVPSHLSKKGEEDGKRR